MVARLGLVLLGVALAFGVLSIVQADAKTVGNPPTANRVSASRAVGIAELSPVQQLASPTPASDQQGAREPTNDSQVQASQKPESPTPSSLGSAILIESFEDVATLPNRGWVLDNNSAPAGTINWFQGNPAVFVAQMGANNAYIGANFNNTVGTGTISNWLLTPELPLMNGAKLVFWTRKATPSPTDFPDRLQVRMSTAGASTNVGTMATDIGDFTTLLLDINPTLAVGGYPVSWTPFTVTLSGLPASTQGRLAFRYFVTNGGPTGVNSDYIGMDTVSYTPAATIALEATVGTDPSQCATTSALTVAPHTPVFYCYRVTNTGAITLTRHDLNDGAIGAILQDFPYTLVPSAHGFITHTLVNTATWTARNPEPSTLVAQATDATTVTVAPVATPTPFPPGSWCRQPNLPIVDNSTISDVLSVPNGGQLTDLNLYLKLSHTFVGDLIVSLTHQNETVIGIDRPGRTSTGFGCGGDNVDALLDDEASLPAETSCHATTGLTTGPYSPNSPLSALDGHDLSGAWTLTLSDNAGADTGTLLEWCLLPTLASPTPTPTPSPTPAPATSLLALYALAFDTSAGNSLAGNYEPAIRHLRAATVTDPNKRAVVLVDMPGINNTFIYIFHQGESTLVAGLPNPAGTLTASLREYDMADGATLGGFLQWARTTYATPSSQVTFAFVGHSGPLIPETNFGAIFDIPTTPREGEPSLFPLPVRIDANPAYTDITPAPRLLSVYQLREAVRVGSQDGSAPFAVLDLVKCFAGSIEELYALSPYATTLVSSPNYTFFAPEMLGEGLAALQAADTPQQLATTLIEEYDSAIAHYDDPTTATDEHPRRLVAVESRVLPLIKERLDEVAYHIWDNYDGALLRNAYLNSTHYDTTLCDPQDWQLEVPDALVDLDAFTLQLVEQFGDPVRVPAEALRLHIEDAIIAQRSHSGVPWFAPDDPFWDFDVAAESHPGLALYADLVGRPANDNIFLSWHAYFYTSTASIANTHPYDFLQGGFKGVTWGALFKRFWTQVPNLATEACLPEIPPLLERGELAVTHLLLPRRATVTNGAPIPIQAALRTDHAILEPVVAFTVTLDSRVVFTDRVQSPPLLTGTHPIAASRPWTPTLANPLVPQRFLLEVTVDPDGRVEESNEDDNRLLVSDVVGRTPTFPRPILNAALAGGTQWLSSPTALLNVGQVAPTPAAPVRTVQVQILQYVAGSAPNHQVPVLRGSQTFYNVNLANPLTLNLPATTQPGVVVLHVWGWSRGHISLAPAVVTFNYIPPNTSIMPNAMHYFLFRAAYGDMVQAHLDVANGGDANLFAWDPYNFGFPNPGWGSATQVGDDTLVIPAAPFDGSYLLAVRGAGASATSYTLTVSRNGIPGGLNPSGSVASRNQGSFIPDSRPIFQQPLPLAPHELFLPLVMR